MTNSRLNIEHWKIIFLLKKHYGLTRRNISFYYNYSNIKLACFYDTVKNDWMIKTLLAGNWNINDFDMAEILKASLATLELGVLEPRAQVLGGVVIFDMGGFTLQHAYQITPKVVSTIFDLIVVCRLFFPK